MGEKYTEAQKKATLKHLKEKTDCLQIRFEKGKKEVYKEMAKRKGISLTKMITEYLESELKKEKQSE